MNDLQKAAAKIAQANKLVISTGAGVSKESGVPTFRDAKQEGLWAQYDPQTLATPQGFLKNPKLVWDWYLYRRQLVEKTDPNPGHYALAELESLLPKVVLVTQNVDNLHQRAGSTDIIPLHGNLFAYKCSADCQGNPTTLDLDSLVFDPDQSPPQCPHCQQGLARPDVVWFGESLPESHLQRAFHEADTCDVMLVVGTSGAVYPAAWLPIRAARENAFLIEVNPDSSELSSIMHVHLQEPSGSALPRLVEAVRSFLSTT